MVSNININPSKHEGLTKRSYVDRSMRDGGFWMRASFTVPVTTPHDRVMDVSDEYVRRAGNIWEAKGYTVKKIYQPVASLHGHDPKDEDRRQYLIWGWCYRRPVTIHYDMPDHMVETAMGMGLKLQE